MLFNSYSFLLFFPAVVLVYYILPKKVCNIWLLAASYYFYMCWNPRYAILIAFTTLVTYGGGLGLERMAQSRYARNIIWKRIIVAACLIVNLGILAFFKYSHFLFENLNTVLEYFHISMQEPAFDILLPVGISFYTFQALSYVLDVYRNMVKAEHSILKYALFISFFPQLVAGPIERSDNLLKQIDESAGKRRLDYDRVTSGLMQMVWGFFLKMVLADKLAIFADTVFNQYTMYGTVVLFLAAAAFGMQIYCDFSAYSAIAIGAARVLGFDLMENFKTPYFSKSIQEFWHRWHISLSTWFRDYLYIPLGGSRCSKWKHYRNIMITFCVSGLWHGADWSYVVWGGLHGFYQIAGDTLRPWKERLNKALHTKTESFSYKFAQTAITFVLVTVTWIFFRADSLRDAMRYLKRMVLRPDFWVLHDGTLLRLGLNQTQIHILLAALLVLLAVSLMQYRRELRLDQYLSLQCIWFRWAVIIGLMAAVQLFGEYGLASYRGNQFIYFQF